ncbi:hypothetical protein GCM10009839_33350 [Catenulispora yoronensis]|uniref:Uncharacterized protein n=2 Tax=Catenulispora yoronensis TaxID=450799 RepID=A0ABN2U8L7_9ACTN
MYFARVNRGTQSLAVDLKKDPNRSQRWPSTPMCWWGTSSPESWTGSARGDPGTQRPPNRPVIATSPTQVLRPPLELAPSDLGHFKDSGTLSGTGGVDHRGAGVR